MTIFGIKPSQRDIVPVGLRRLGFEATSDGKKSIYDKYLNQLIFETQFDHVWGTETQTKADPPESTFYTDVSGNPLDASDSAVTFNHDDRIVMVHDTALTANLVIDGGGKRLNITTVRGIAIDLGADAGNSNVPYKIQLKNADQSNCHFRTNKDYLDVLSVKAAATRSEQSVISNQTENSVIYLNNRQIFGRNLPVQLTYKEKDPYFLFLDGTSGLSQHEYKDLFKRIKYSFTTAGQIGGAVANSQFTIPNTKGKFTRLGNAGGANDINGVHRRTAGASNFSQWPNTLTNISASFAIGSNEVRVNATVAGTQADNIAFLQSCVGLRVVADLSGLVPDSTSGTPKTSIIRDVNISTPSAVVLTLIDSVDGSAANANVTNTANDIVISNSGNVQGSEELDSMQEHNHLDGFGWDTVQAGNNMGIYGVFTAGDTPGLAIRRLGTFAGAPISQTVSSPTKEQSGFGSPRSSLETKPTSTLKFEYWAV
jgi:hypothetical protein